MITDKQIQDAWEALNESRGDTKVRLADFAAGALWANQKAVNDALDAMEDMLHGWRYIRRSHGELYGVGWDRAEKKMESAILALTGVKP